MAAICNKINNEHYCEPYSDRLHCIFRFVGSVWNFSFFRENSSEPALVVFAHNDDNIQKCKSKVFATIEKTKLLENQK